MPLALFSIALYVLNRELSEYEVEDLVAEAWLTRAQKRVAKAWLAEHSVEDDTMRDAE